ncbi:DUF4834 family protein [Siphonobacter sp. SORGH_AS_1065]|uniref:DUF4834 family protein n=1 Tax=Siphonobacter sp. SORGH_AS_1065 TaxID=3041795 RepID=UPI00278B6D61|nr:DUF4834 family protein [Siphonobacter sp. SORGH_AS_1065]MDQ1087368.1 hypothetical protein [Siphonobacter sp. SORGH_AS_1065]
MIFKIFLVIMAIGFIFPRIVRWVFRLFLKEQFSRVEREFRQDQQRSSQSRPREGKINVDYAPPRKEGYKGGDYIDYEEVKN